LLETFDLRFSKAIIATYVLTNADGTVTFSTGAGIGNGKIIIEDYNAVNKTVTRTFKFNGMNIYNNPLVGPTMSFQYGTFYKVPVTTLTL
jgi:hypothetical protein